MSDIKRQKPDRPLEELLAAAKRITETSARLTREMKELASQIADEKAKREDQAGRRFGKE
jgi:hypothetical protein